MKILHTLLVLICLYSLSLCDINSQCQLCFNSASSYKYCMLSMDSATGKCCLSGSSDDCLNDQFYCSNKISTSFTYHKFAFCSFNPTICGNSQRNLKAIEVKQTVSTSLEFQNDDVCPYILVSDTNLPFNTDVELKIDSAINTDVFVLTGSSMDSIKTQKQLYSGSSMTFDAGTIAIIIVRGTYANAYASFSYQNIQKLSNASWIGIIIGSSFGYFLILMIVLIIVTRKLTQRRLRELQSPNIVYFLKKKVIQYLTSKPTNQNFTKQQTQMPKVGMKDYFTKKIKEYERVKAIDLNNLHDNRADMYDNAARQETGIDRMQSARTGISQISTNIPQTNQLNIQAVEKPKYTITPNCNTCLTTTTTKNKYCLPYEDSSTGYCCDTAGTTDFCSQNTRYLCTDAVSSNSMKLYLCPNSQSKCYSTSSALDFDQNTYSKVIYVGDEAKQLGGTTLDFTKDDICSWRMIANSQYIANKIIRITFNQLYQASCYINTGYDIRSASSEVSCAQGTQYDFDADKSVFIITQGTTSGAAIHFTYQLIDRITFTQVAIIYSVAVAVFIILAAIIAVLTVRFVIQLTIRNNQQTWQKMSLEMKNIVDNAQKQKDFQKIGTVEDIDQHYQRTETPASVINNNQGPSAQLGSVKPWNNNPIHFGPNPSTNNAQFNLY